MSDIFPPQIKTMSQLSFSEAEYRGKGKRTRREKFLNEMDKTIPWGYLAGEVAKH